MNKKELIEKIESLPSLTSITSIRPYVDKKVVLGLISQLDEPEKVVIPQFVADVIEGAREQSAELEDAFEYVWEVAIGELREWFRKLENRDNFARAWLDGYEVEKEKKYLVKLKGASQYLRKDELGTRFDSLIISYFTRNDIEDLGFGWVFDCPGIEIEEVKE